MDVDNDKHIRNPDGSLYMIIQNRVTVTFVPLHGKQLFFLDVPFSSIECLRLHEMVITDALRHEHKATQLVLVLKPSCELEMCLINAKEEMLNMIALTFGSPKEAKEAMVSLQGHLDMGHQSRVWNSAPRDVSNERHQPQPLSGQSTGNQHQIDGPGQNSVTKKLGGSNRSNASHKRQQVGNFKLLPGAMSPEPAESAKDTLRVSSLYIENGKQHNDLQRRQISQKKLLAPAIKVRKAAIRTYGMKAKNVALLARVRPTRSENTQKDIYEISQSECDEQLVTDDKQPENSRKGKAEKMKARAKAAPRTKVALKKVAGRKLSNATRQTKGRVSLERLMHDGGSEEKLNIFQSELRETRSKRLRTLVQTKVDKKKNRALLLTEHEVADVSFVNDQMPIDIAVPTEDGDTVGKKVAIHERSIFSVMKISPHRASLDSPKEVSSKAGDVAFDNDPNPETLKEAQPTNSNPTTVNPQTQALEKKRAHELTSFVEREMQVHGVSSGMSNDASAFHLQVLSTPRTEVVAREQNMENLPRQDAQQQQRLNQPPAAINFGLDEVPARKPSIISFDRAGPRNQGSLSVARETAVTAHVPSSPPSQIQGVQIKATIDKLPTQEAKRVSAQSETVSSPRGFISMLNALNGTMDIRQSDKDLKLSSTTRRNVLQKPVHEAASIIQADDIFVDIDELLEAAPIGTTFPVTPMFANKSLQLTRTMPILHSITKSDSKAGQASRRKSVNSSYRGLHISDGGSPVPKKARVIAEHETSSTTHNEAIGRMVKNNSPPKTGNEEDERHNLSSNSKPLPQSPGAESRAISGYALGDIVEDVVAKTERPKITNPFNNSKIFGKSGKPSAFAQKLAEVAVKNVTNIDTAGWDRSIPTNEPIDDMTSDSSCAENFGEKQPLEDYDIPGEMEWGAALLPRHRTILDILSRISRRLVIHLVDSETAVNDIIEDYVRDGNELLENLEKSRREQCENLLRTVKTSKLKLVSEYKKSAEKVDSQRKSTSEGMRRLEDWKRIQEVTALQVERLEVMAKCE
jgi:hypothetical protein